MYFSGKNLSDVKNGVRRLVIPEGTTGIYSSALSPRADVIYVILSQLFHLEIDISECSVTLMHKKLEKSQKVFKKNFEQLTTEVPTIISEVLPDRKEE